MCAKGEQGADRAVSYVEQYAVLPKPLGDTCIMAIFARIWRTSRLSQNPTELVGGVVWFAMRVLKNLAPNVLSKRRINGRINLFKLSEEKDEEIKSAACICFIVAAGRPTAH